METRYVGSITQIETQHTLAFPDTVPDGYAVCTACGLTMNRDEWARTACSEKPA